MKLIAALLLGSLMVAGCETTTITQKTEGQITTYSLALSADRNAVNDCKIAMDYKTGDVRLETEPRTLNQLAKLADGIYKEAILPKLEDGEPLDEGELAVLVCCLNVRMSKMNAANTLVLRSMQLESEKSLTYDMVAHQTKELASGNFTMLNVPFVNTTDANAGLQLNKDITVANVTASAASTTEADQIRVWVPANNGYRAFFRYAGDTVEGVTYKPGWCDADDYEWGYIEDSTDFADGIPLGAAMFYKAKKGAGKTMTGSGAIEAQDEVELPLAGNNFTMIGNPYPTSLQLNGEKFIVANVTASAASTTEADQIRVWVPANNGYRAFFRYAGDTVDGVTYKPGWCDADDYEWGYIEDSTDFADGIPVGTAMFYKAKKGEGKSAVFTSPLVTE